MKYLFCLTLFLYGLNAYALEKIKGSLAFIPEASVSKEVGPFPLLVNAMSEVEGIPIDYGIVPFSRSMNSIIKGDVDFHFPLIEPLEKEGLPFSLSTDSVYKVNFVLYYNKNKKVSLSGLKDVVIETEAAHVKYFPFKVTPSSCIDCSLKKLNIGRIDGFIYADTATDFFLKKHKLLNIRRKLYKRFNVKFVIKKGSQGGEIDMFISKSLNRLKKSGKLKAIFGSFNDDYDDWQINQVAGDK